MSNILVTGATGFIGSSIADRLYDMGHTIIASGRGGEVACKHHVMLSSNLDGLEKVGNIDVCFHQAAHNDTTDGDAKRMFEANCRMSIDLFAKVASLGCGKIVYASSASVYGFSPSPQREDCESSPTNVYSRSKDILEMLASGFSERTGCVCVGLRYFNVYGSREAHKGKRASMVFQLCSAASEGKDIKVFKWGEQSRDWVSVDDVVDANLAAMAHEKSDVFNVGSGTSTSINDLLAIISDELGESPKIEYVDNPYLEAYQSHTMASLDKITSETGYKPKVDIDRGVRDLLRQIKKPRV